jgi:hypothetical protein
MTFNPDAKQHRAMIELIDSDNNHPAMVIVIKGQLLIEDVVNILISAAFTEI